MSEHSPGVQRYVNRGAEMTAADAQHRANMRQKKFETIAVHGAYSQQAALSNQGSIIEPTYMSTSQHFENSDHMEASLAYLMPSWTYSRIANPTVSYLEQTLALLEGYGYAGDVSAVATASGAAANFLATDPLLANPDHQPLNVVVSARCYGGTFMLFTRYANERGVDVRWVQNPLDVDEWASKMDAQTRFVFGEMPSNPGLSCMPMAEVAEAARSQDIPFIVDSTVATPALMRPLLHGADVVVHSVSKSMTTSGFAIAGAVIARHDMTSRFGADEMKANYALYLKGLVLRDYGPGLSPFNAMMTLNDLRTLRQRMDVISQNTQTIAQYLEDHPGVEKVYYPGLPSMEEHEQAQKYMWLVDAETPTNRYGHLLSFTVKAGAQATRTFFDRLNMIYRATDLGRIKSVATIPTISTHQQQGDAGRDLASIPPNLVRLNVGGEHPDDIIADLDQALAGL